MPTKIARVKVTPIEAGAGFSITCSACSLRLLRATRPWADQAAGDHQRSHITPDPEGGHL